MGSTKKIIIIDDDDMLRDTLKEQFSLHDEFLVADHANATAGVKAVKADPRFAELPLVRQSRLSVQPVSDAYWRMLCELGGLKP